MLDRASEWPRILPCGDCALSVELGDAISPQVHDRVVALLEALPQSGLPLVETVPTYRSVFVEYDALEVDFATVVRRIREVVSRMDASERTGRCWEIPVVYGGSFGNDLPALAERHALTQEELVARHSAKTYRVYMIGFTPGFTYLGGLDGSLATPRLAVPRREAPQGSISIGGAQTAISGIAAPSGWHHIGRTPVWTYRPEVEPPCFLAPGDSIRFAPLAESDWHELALASYRGVNVARILA